MDIDTLADRSCKCAHCEKKLSLFSQIIDLLIEIVTFGHCSIFSKFIEKDQVWVHKKCKDVYILEKYL